MVYLGPVIEMQQQIRAHHDEMTGRAAAQRILEHKPYVLEPLPQMVDYHKMNDYDRMRAFSKKGL